MASGVIQWGDSTLGLMLAQLVTERQPYQTTRRHSAPTTVAAAATAADVAAAARGDRHAFERLYDEHVNRVYALCARMLGDRTVADEATQDVFVRVWQKLPGFRGESAFSTWLHRVAVNVVLSRQKATGLHDSRAASNEDSDALLAIQAASVGDRFDLESAIAGLPQGARRIFVLHDVEGFTHEEIGDQLGITSGGSKAQLHRARMLLRAALNR